MTKTRHNVGCTDKLWELMRREGGNASDLLDEIIEQKYGKYKSLYDSFHFCSKCKKTIKNWSDINLISSNYKLNKDSDFYDCIVVFKACASCWEHFKKKEKSNLKPYPPSDKLHVFNLFKSGIDESASWVIIHPEMISIDIPSFCSKYDMDINDFKHEAEAYT